MLRQLHFIFNWTLADAKSQNKQFRFHMNLISVLSVAGQRCCFGRDMGSCCNSVNISVLIQGNSLTSLVFISLQGESLNYIIPKIPSELALNCLIISISSQVSCEFFDRSLSFLFSESFHSSYSCKSCVYLPTPLTLEFFLTMFFLSTLAATL